MKICQYCGTEKENELGLCLNCHRFPATNSFRESAIKWWNDLMPLKRRELVTEYFIGRRVKTLTGREIEMIWKLEA